jgi:hypothetical protein
MTLTDGSNATTSTVRGKRILRIYSRLLAAVLRHQGAYRDTAIGRLAAHFPPPKRLCSVDMLTARAINRRLAGLGKCE